METFTKRIPLSSGVKRVVVATYEQNKWVLEKPINIESKTETGTQTRTYESFNAKNNLVDVDNKPIVEGEKYVVIFEYVELVGARTVSARKFNDRRKNFVIAGIPQTHQDINSMYDALTGIYTDKQIKHKPAKLIDELTAHSGEQVLVYYGDDLSSMDVTNRLGKVPSSLYEDLDVIEHYRLSSVELNIKENTRSLNAGNYIFSEEERDIVAFMNTLFENMVEGEDAPIITIGATGPTGSGKSELGRAFSNYFGYKFLKVDLSAITETTDLFAMREIVNDNGTPVTKFEWTKFTEAIRSDEPYVILLDELTRAPRGVGNVLLGLLDDFGSVTVMGEVISINRSSPKIIIASANHGREYGNLMGSDAALNNRWLLNIHKDYDEQVEKALLLAFVDEMKALGDTNYNLAFVTQMQKCIKDIRTICANLGVNDNTIFSTRSLTNILKQIKTWRQLHNVNEAVTRGFRFGYTNKISDEALVRGVSDAVRIHFS